MWLLKIVSITIFSLMSNLLTVGKTFSYLIQVISLSWLMIDEEDLKQDLTDEEDLKGSSINKM